MQNEFSMINPSPVEERRADTGPIIDEMNRVRETVEQTRNDIKRTRRDLDEHVEKYQSRFRRILVFGAIVVLIVAGLIGFSWYGYSSLKDYGPLLTQVPGLQKLASTMNDRLTSMEGKVTDWVNDQTSLTERMAKIETTVGSNLRTARSQAESLANQVGQRIREEIGQNLERLQSRVLTMESSQRETLDHVSQLQSEIGNLHQEIASLQQQNAERLSDLRQATQSDVDAISSRMTTMNNQVTTMNNQVIAHANRLVAVSNQIDRERVVFEVSMDKTQLVAPGIYVTLKHADVPFQKVDGWMQLADEGRIMWIRGLGLQQALTFVTRADDRTHELVFTRVDPTGATGYVLLPMGPSSASSSN